MGNTILYSLVRKGLKIDLASFFQTLKPMVRILVAIRSVLREIHASVPAIFLPSIFLVITFFGYNFLTLKILKNLFKVNKITFKSQREILPNTVHPVYSLIRRYAVHIREYTEPYSTVFHAVVQLLMQKFYWL